MESRPTQLHTVAPQRLSVVADDHVVDRGSGGIINVDAHGEKGGVAFQLVRRRHARRRRRRPSFGLPLEDSSRPSRVTRVDSR